MKKHILISGSHRSGSTWAGNVLAQASNVRYVHEPFNIGIPRSNSPLRYWFEYISKKHKSQKSIIRYLNSFIGTFNKYMLKQLLLVRSINDFSFLITDIKSRIKYRAIIKDPLAIMSAEWIYKKYNWNILILIRHPAAFIASLKVKDWQFDYNHLINQQELLETSLKKYQAEIYDYAEKKRDIIDQGILLWNIIHDVILSYESRYSHEWLFLRHEDLSLNPLQEFKKVFKHLDLSFDQNVQNYIIETSNAIEKSELKRNSANNIKSWKNRLSQDEIKRINEGTRQIWTKFYSENDW